MSEASMLKPIPGAKRFTLMPGSAMWLLRHELRMFFYEMGGTSHKEKHKGKRGLGFGSMAAFLVLLVIMHFVAWGALHFMPSLATLLTPMVYMFIGVALFVVFTLMLSLALGKSVSALFERGDVDLLLSSPMSSKVIFQVRLAGIAGGVGFNALFFLSPFANVGALLGQLRWLGIYPTIICMSVISASLAMWATLGLVKTFGIRKTRVIAQLLGALVGAIMFLASQVFGNMGSVFKESIKTSVLPWFKEGGALGPDSWAWIPAKALFGSPFELLVFVLLSCLCFYVVSQTTHQFFVRGVQQGTEKTRAALPSPEQLAQAIKSKSFTGGLTRNVVLKEWRLIWRDPQLISQILLQILYMLPLFFVIFKGSVFLPGAAAGMTMLSALLVSSLVWIVVSGEDAPDLIAAAPVAQNRVRRAKLIAAVTPPFLFILLPLLWLGLRSPSLAILTLGGCCLAMHNIGLINLWMAKPGNRSEFNRRAHGSVGLTILEKINSIAWAGTVYVSVQFGWWGLIPALFAVIALLLAWIFKLEHV